jgi:hypothetical protein
MGADILERDEDEQTGDGGGRPVSDAWSEPSIRGFVLAHTACFDQLQCVRLCPILDQGPFSTTGSTEPDLFDALHINLTAAASDDSGDVDVTLSPADGPFQASKAPPGIVVSAQYHMAYVISGPTALRTPNLKISGGATGQPAYYAVTSTANGTPVAVNSAGRPSNSVNLSGNPTRLTVIDDIILNAASTRGLGTTPLAPGFALINRPRGAEETVGGQVHSAKTNFVLVPPT